jgi:uncharacterized protein YeaO (DUF488 family)
MKTIHTSYFAVAKNLPEDLSQVAIARYCPAYWVPPGRKRRLYEKRLAPSKELLAGCKAGTIQDWRAVYRQEIEAAGTIGAIYESLPDRCVLLCWERDWGDCHRKVLWEMLRERFGVEGGEYVLAPTEPKPRKRRSAEPAKTLF